MVQSTQVNETIGGDGVVKTKGETNEHQACRHGDTMAMGGGGVGGFFI